MQSLVEQQRLNILRRGGTPEAVKNASGKIIKYINVSGGDNNLSTKSLGGGKRTRRGRKSRKAMRRRRMTRRR